MASSRKPPNVELGSLALAGRRVAVGLSGGIDSVVLLHLLARSRPGSLSAVHVHHGLSPNADAWARHCRSLCRRLGVPLTVRRVKVFRKKHGLEAAAREARFAVFEKMDCDALALAHNLDDQAETVLMNLLRGAGPRGAAAMRAKSVFRGKELLRPLLGTPREAIEAYARGHGLEWIEDESNADETLTRNFVRRRLGPLIASRFPQWKESLARAARHFGESELSANRLLREYLLKQGLRAPGEARLLEMLKQLRSGSPRLRIEHDGASVRAYRGELHIERVRPTELAPRAIRAAKKLDIPELDGELRFRRATGDGIAAKLFKGGKLVLKPRGGGERLQPDAKRPRRSLKNLFQEAGVPSWVRERMPLLYCGDELAWAPGLGIDVRFRAAPGAVGWIPEWKMT
jgi:tRNA(Ile)-lysidine synthase